MQANNANNSSPNNGTRKTIQINHDFFKIGKKGGAPNKVTRSATTKKVKPLKKNTIKQELTKRIQERKQKDLDDIYQKRSDTESSQEHQPVQTELSKSLSYLNEFVKNKKKQRSVTGTGVVKKKARNKTIKQRSEPMVNVDLPTELIMGISPTIIPPIVQHMIPAFATAPTTAPLTAYTYTTTAPPYSNLKNSTGGKPSYRAWNQTRKRSSGSMGEKRTGGSTSTNTIRIGGTDDSDHGLVIPHEPSERERKLAAAKKKPTVSLYDKKIAPIVIPMISTPTVPVPAMVPVNVGGNVQVPVAHAPAPTQRTIRRTVKRTYTVGRRKGGKTVSVLIKNLKTRKKVHDAKKVLKKAEIGEIKSFLKSKGLLKSGSVAPPNVLREMYESAMMAGDVHNLNDKIAMHNYITDDDN
jgi:hypothetical protein